MRLEILCLRTYQFVIFPWPPRIHSPSPDIFRGTKKRGGNRLAIPPQKNPTKTISKDRLLLPRNPTAGLLRFFFEWENRCWARDALFSPNKKRALDYSATDGASVPTIKSVRTQLMSLSPSVYGFGRCLSAPSLLWLQRWDVNNGGMTDDPTSRENSFLKIHTCGKISSLQSSNSF